MGTVGQSLVKLLRDNAEHIAHQAGRAIVLTRVANRSVPTIDLGDAQFDHDLLALVAADDVDVVVELIGGEDTALAVAKASIAAGKSFVTGNKALIAQYGEQLFSSAAQAKVKLGFEAAVAGGIPILNVLQESLSANKINCVAGIINGTANYILTSMTQSGESFENALSKAQSLGYAEADPTFDVGGIDAAHKLTILARLGLGIPFRFEDIYIEGIADIITEDLVYAKELGYRVKHLGIARRSDRGVELRVHPTLIPEAQLLAQVNGVMNAVLVNGDGSGATLHFGAGAGGLPTASAVVGDLIQLAKNGLHLPPQARTDERILPISEIQSAYYLKIPVLDQPGVLARLSNLLSEHFISIEAVIQREGAIRTTDERDWVPIVILTHRIAEADMDKALADLQSLPEVIDQIVRIRVEAHLHE